MTTLAHTAMKCDTHTLHVEEDYTIVLHGATTQRFKAADLTYFALVGKDGGWQLRFSTKKQTNFFMVEGYEAGLLLHQVWLACPTAVPIAQNKGCPRPRSRYIYALRSLENEAAIFQPDEKDTQRKILRSNFHKVKLTGSSVGQTWKWWLDTEGGALRGTFYVNEPKVYEKLFTAWAQ